MVSQELVQQVMEKLNRPCTTRDITNYIIENKLLNIKENSIICDVSGVLNVLRKWYIVGRYPDHHGVYRNKWYLTSSDGGHDSNNCKYCKGITKAHNRNIAQYMIRSTNRRVRLTEDEEDIVFKDDEYI